MQTFRMPRELVSFLREEANRNGRDLTAFVNRQLDGLRTWFGLPEAASTLLEAGAPYTLEDLLAALSEPAALRTLASEVHDLARRDELEHVAGRW
jgi:hypothetical protein